MESKSRVPMDFVSEKRSGERLTAAELSAIIRALKSRVYGSVGFSDPEGGTALLGREGVRNRFIKFVTADTVPPYSVFTLTGTDAPPWDDAVAFRAVKASDAPTGLLFTNGDLEIPAGAWGYARPVNDFDTARLDYDAGDAPAVGDECGPLPDTWQIGSAGSGLVCVALDADNYRADVMRVTPTLQWFKLTANLDSERSATAQLGRWDEAQHRWLETLVETTIYDTTEGDNWGLKGEWLPARAVNGVWEVLRPGRAFHTAVLQADLASGGTATGHVTIDGDTAVITVHDHGSLGLDIGKKIVSGSAVRVWWDDAWYADWTRCGNIV